MRHGFLFFASMLLWAGFFVGCSNNKEELFGVEDSNEAEIAYNTLLIDDEPYISPGMQALINKLDTSDVALPLEELMPGMEALFLNDTTSVEQNVATRATSTGMFTGYTNKKFLFQNKQVSLTAYNSLFKESLDCSFTTSGTVYLSAIAVWYNIYFDDPVSYFEAEAEIGDFTGIEPDSFNADNICNDTYFNRGFSCEEKYSGYSYRLTTYLIVMSTSTSFYDGYVLPYKKNSTYLHIIDWYCESLQWSYFYVE